MTGDLDFRSRARHRPATGSMRHGARFAAALGTIAVLAVPLLGQDAQLEHAPPPAVVPDELLGRERVTTTPGQRYDAGAIHRFFFGDLNRDIWTIPFEVPVLNLDSVAGGLEVDQLSGGLQTLGLRLAGDDGQVYQFRSIVKSPERAIPGPLLSTPVNDVAQDQMGAQFPLGALVAAEITEAAGILVAKPRVVVMPDDPRLGEYREAFAGRMGWIEVRPNEGEGDRPGFAGSTKVTGTEALFERLQEGSTDFVNQRKLLRARLVDFLLHDWDRHMDQWRWASFEEGDRVRWDPIPRDRDWAFSSIDGVFPRLSAVYFPQYTGFNDDRVDIQHLTWSAQLVDRTLLTGLDRGTFHAEARSLQQAITDQVIEDAVGVLPEPYQQAVGARLIRGLRLRRDALPDIADEFYLYLAGWVDVFGTEEDESVVATRLDGGRLRVEVRSPGPEGHTTYDRTFVPGETGEVRLYLLDGDDEVRITGTGPGTIRLNIVPGDGDDRISDDTSGQGVGVYGDKGDDDFELGRRAWVTGRFTGEPEIDDAYLILSRRDWGTSVIPRPELSYDSDEGVYLGASITRYGYGFEYDPYRSRYQAKLMNGLAADQWKGSVEFERPFSHGRWRVWADVDGHTELPTRFFGLGNDVAAPGDEDDYKTVRSSVATRTGIRFRPDETWQFGVGAALRASGAVDPGTPVAAPLVIYGSGDFKQAELQLHAQFDSRDDLSLPRKGLVARLEAKAAPALLDVASTFGTGEVTLRGFLPLGKLPLDPVIHLRGVGQTTFGDAPFRDLSYLGGQATLPGLARRRYLGTSMASGGSLLRLKLFDTNRLSGLDVGVHGMAATGRVWLDGESSDTWHSSYGGGIWVHFDRLNRTGSLTLAQGEDRLHVYLNLGFIF